MGEACIRGNAWIRVNDNANLTQRPWYYHHIFADPRDRNTVYVLNVGFWKSTDGGVTFRTVRVPHGALMTLPAAVTPVGW